MDPTQYAPVGETLQAYQETLRAKLWLVADTCCNMEQHEYGQVRAVMYALVETFFAFLRQPQTTLSPEIGLALHQAGATAMFLSGLNKAMREFCLAHLPPDLWLAGLEATADYFGLLVQVYIQTNQGVLQLGFISKQQRDRLGLTAMEVRLLQHLAQGQNNQQIAAALGVTDRSIVNYLRKIRRKLGTSNRGETILAAAQLFGEG